MLSDYNKSAICSQLYILLRQLLKLLYVLSYIFSAFDSRYCWVAILVCCVGFFLVQFSANMAHFLRRPTNINNIVKYEDQLIFPAITICNQNNFRLVLLNGNVISCSSKAKGSNYQSEASVVQW